MITLSSTGSFKNTDSFFDRILNKGVYGQLDEYGKEGVRLLQNATPINSGITAESWSYEVIKQKGNRYALIFHNSHMVEGESVAIMIQYGHATGTGGYVQGRDYINPAIMPLFDKAVNAIWKEVTS